MAPNDETPKSGLTRRDRMRPVKKISRLAVLAWTGLVASFAISPDIFEAVRQGDVATVKTLLDRDPGLVNAADRQTLGPLHWAALKGHRQVAELLLARGANINQKTRLGRTPLNIAVQHNHPDMADFLSRQGADPAPWTWPQITGDYVGEDVPGTTPRLFSPEILSSSVFDHAAPEFTRDGNEVFWGVVFEDDTGVLMGMKREGGAWSRLKPLPFSEARFRDICPTLSADETKLTFTSCRPVSEAEKPGEFNMLVVDRKPDGWSEPRLLAPEIRSGKDARPVFTGNGSMYFGSWRDGAIDGSNIFISKRVKGEFEKPKRLDAPFNTANAMPTFIAPNESVIIFESLLSGGMGGSDFWLSIKNPDGAWGPAINLGAPINSRANDWFGGFSPDGRYLFFVSDRDGNNDIYWVAAEIMDRFRLKR